MSIIGVFIREDREGSHKERKYCDHGGRDRSSTATSQGILVATRRWKRQGTDSPLECPEEAEF